MAQNTNLNISPYFDDFDDDKGFLKVLFKPGFPVPVSYTHLTLPTTPYV